MTKKEILKWFGIFFIWVGLSRLISALIKKEEA